MTELIEEFAQTKPARKIDSYQGPATNQGYPSQAVQERSQVLPVEFLLQPEPWLLPSRVNPLEPPERPQLHPHWKKQWQIDSLETHRSTLPNQLGG